MHAVCPHCGNAESCQAVRAIVASQTAHSTGFSARGGATSVNSRTSLAGMLSLPSGRPGVGIWVWGIVLLVLGIGLGSLFFIGSLSSKPDPESPIPHFAMAVLIGVVISAGLWIPGLIMTLIGLGRIFRFKREAPLRRRMAALWHQSAYCHRDDVVYLPHGPWSPPGAFRPMLRAEARRG